MAVTVVRYTTRPERADENQALVEKVFGELAEHRPEGLRYATFRLEDGVTFVHVASTDTADGSNPLATTAAFGEFQQQIADELPISRPAVSRHLRLLKDAGLVIEEPIGTRRIYRLQQEGVEAVEAYLRQVWGEAATRFRLAAENTTPRPPDRRRRERS